MKRTEFEQFIEENQLKSIHTFHGDFSYTSNAYSIDTYQYGVIEKNGRYLLQAIEYGDRGPCLSYSFYGKYESEEVAFDELKKKVLFYASRTYNHELESQIQEFYKSIRFKKISRGLKYNNEIDLSFDEYQALIDQFFSQEFITDIDYGNLKVYSNKYHTLIFEITSHYVYDRDNDGYFIPYMLKTDDKRQLMSQPINSTYSDCKWDDDGIYVLFYNSLVAFSKYDFHGNLLYEVKWSTKCDLRTCNSFMKFIRSSFCINPISYAPNNPKYPDKSYIAITNGIQYGIFNRETGKLEESNYDHKKDKPD